MKLKYISEYLSIKEFEEIELSDFSVITGVNGAGKSHFLNAINNGNIKIEGIGSENIILYNYNDFNVINVDLNQNDKQISDLKNKFEAFNMKSQIASQKYQEERNRILSSVNIDRHFASFYLSDEFIANLKSFDVFNWTEEDKLYYSTFDIDHPNTEKPDYHKFVSFQAHLSMYGIHRMEEIDNFIEFLKNKVNEIQALNIIVNFNYSKELTYIDDVEFKKVFDLFYENSKFDFWNEEYRSQYSHIILDIFGNFIDFNLIRTLNPSKFLSSLKYIYDKIEDHFRNNIDEGTLKLIEGINGDKILDFISFGNGFFNLNDLALEEKNFQIQKYQNNFNKFQKSMGESTHFYSDEDFTKFYGESPIKILNDVLSEYDVNGYEFRGSNLSPDLSQGMQNQHIHIYLHNKNGNFQTQLESLSSGEKTLLALAFSVYKLKKNRVLAKVLLMDELDSALHPSMSKRLIIVLYNYFHKTLGIKIIISSHSPSTIAFSPNDSLYIIKKESINKLQSVSKDEALKELTIGVPSFSISYENRRQIFVESKYDVEYYGALYDIFQKYLDKEISLNFIASGDVQKDKNRQSNSSCNVVKSVTEILRNAGNNSIFGIIDWDLAKIREEKPYIITLGFGSRYSIENYIFDPLLVGIFLLKEKIVKADYFGFDKSFSLEMLFKLTQENCQIIVDKICNTIIQKIGLEKISKIINDTSKNTINPEAFLQEDSYITVCEFKLQIPNFIKFLQGHKLEEYLTEVFPKLREYSRQKEDLLKKAFISKIIEDFDGYAPNDLLEVFKEIQKQ